MLKNLPKTVVAWALCSACAAVLRAQIPMAGPPYVPGEFTPVLGSGAQYEFTSTDGTKTHWTFAVVGKERVQRKDAYWLEARVVEGKRAGPITDSLILTQGKNQGTVRVVVQEPDTLPTEIPVFPAKENAKRGFDSGLRDNGLGEKAGTETITTPAGTFECEHYRGDAYAGGGDVWVSASVAPFGVVKWTPAPQSTAGIASVVLEKVLVNEKSQMWFAPHFGVWWK